MFPSSVPLALDGLPEGQVKRFWLHLVTDGMGLPVFIPIIVECGVAPGPVVGLTAVVHGNELNGIPVVQRLFREINPKELRGTIVGVPVVNWIVSQFDYLLDLHTASFGRINSYYICADMNDENARRMALLQNAQIILHNPPSDGTLCGFLFLV